MVLAGLFLLLQVGTGVAFAAAGTESLTPGALAPDAARYLPVQAFNSLVSHVQHDSAAPGRAASRAAAAGNPPPRVREWEVLLPLTVGWAALFFAAAFVVHRRRDL